MSNIVEITSSEQFDEICRNNKNVMLDFYATWCNPCTLLGKFIKSHASEYPNVVFCKANVEKLEDMTDEFEVSSIPHVEFFKSNSRMTDKRMFGFDEKALVVVLKALNE